MVVKVKIQNPNGSNIISKGYNLEDYITEFSYKYIEGLENDECSVTFIFPTVEICNVFTLLRGQHFLITYGFTHQLSKTRSLVLDKIKKKVNKSGVEVELILIPLIEYKSRTYPMSVTTAWDSIVSAIKNGTTVELSWPELGDQKQTYNLATFDKSLNPDGYTILTEDQLKTPKLTGLGDKYPTIPFSETTEARGFPQGYSVPPSGLDLEKFDAKGYAQSLSMGLFDEIATLTDQVAGLIADTRDDYIVIKERDLEQRPVAVIEYPGEYLLEYSINEADKAIASESMVQTIVDEKTKTVGVVSVSSLGDDYRKIPLTHVGRDLNNPKGTEPFLKHYLYTNGKSFYVTAGTKEFDKSTPETSTVITGGTEDFWTLVAVASREDGDPQGQADVAQSIYNRLGSGLWASSIRGIILTQGHYAPTWQFPYLGEEGVPNPEWYFIRDIKSAMEASGKSEGSLAKVAEALLNPSLQSEARNFVGGRTDFRGYYKSGAKQRKVGDNYFGWYDSYQGTSIANVPDFGADKVNSTEVSSTTEYVVKVTDTNRDILVAQVIENLKRYVQEGLNLNTGKLPDGTQLLSPEELQMYHNISVEASLAPFAEMEKDSTDKPFYGDTGAAWAIENGYRFNGKSWAELSELERAAVLYNRDLDGNSLSRYLSRPWDVMGDMVSAETWLKNRAANQALVSFSPYSKEGLIDQLVKLTTDETLNKRELSVTIEGRTDLSVGNTILFNSSVNGDSGRYYIVEIEDSITQIGFITKVVALKIPESHQGLRSYFSSKADQEGWQVGLDELSSKIYESLESEYNYLKEHGFYTDPCKVPSQPYHYMPLVKIRVLSKGLDILGPEPIEETETPTLDD